MLRITRSDSELNARTSVVGGAIDGAAKALFDNLAVQ